MNPEKPEVIEAINETSTSVTISWRIPNAMYHIHQKHIQYTMEQVTVIRLEVVKQYMVQHNYKKYSMLMEQSTM